MKNLLHLSFVLLVGASLLSQTGCGGGGGGSDSGPAGGAGNPSLAPPNIIGRSVQLSELNRPDQTIQFASTGNDYLFFVPGEAQRSGTYTYSAANNSATLRLVDSANNETITFTLNFETEASGSFSYTSSAGRSGTGSFRNFTVRNDPAPNPPNGGQNPPPPDPGPNPGGGDPGNPPPAGGGNGNNGGGGVDPGQGGNDPGNDTGGLNGRVLRLIRSTGQTHTYTFTETAFVDSDPPEEGRGTYTYTRTGSQATLILNYTSSNGPVSLAGDRHDITLTFTSGERGSYDSSYTTNDGTVLPQSGSFEFVQ